MSEAGLKSVGLRPTADVLSRKTDDGMVLLNAATGFCWHLNKTGTFIWERVLAGATSEQIGDALAQAHAGLGEQAAHDDVRAFVGRLRQEGLIAER